MKRKTKIIIIHGAYGSSNENWFPWLADKIYKLGYNTLIPELPTPDNQNLNNWQVEFKKQVGKISPNTILVGHSLAPSFILYLLENISEPIVGVFLVSGFVGKLGLEEFDSINETFVCRNFNWKKIIKNAGIIHIYNSDNDPYVPLKKGKELAKKLNVKLKIINKGGHLNTSAGFTKFPILFQDIKNLLEGINN